MALNASALVIGVDSYDNPAIQKLSGCVADAIAAVDWLMEIGVPVSNIFLHTSPEDVSPKDTLPLRTPALAANLDSITWSMQKLQERGGDQLFVFMSGHGLHVLGEGPIFLPSNYAYPSMQANLKVDEYIRWFLSWPYRDQFVFYDACQTPTVAIGRISAVQAAGPGLDPKSYAPFPGNGLTACYSASAGQTAWDGKGHGVLTSHIVAALNPDRWAKLSADAQEQDAILYDWSTGDRQVDLKALFNRIIKPAIEGEVAAAGYVGQTPFCRLSGRMEDEDEAPILCLPPEPCSEILISIDPVQAATAVLQVRLTIPTPSRVHYLRNPPEAFTPPIRCLAPTGTILEARCREKEGSNWRTRNSPWQEILTKPAHDLVFEFDQPTASPQSDSPLFNVRAVDGLGNQAAPFVDYAKVAAEAGLSTTPPAGVSLAEHEYGPNVGFEPEAEAAALQYAHGWLQAFRPHLTAQGYSVLLSPPGEPPFALPHNFRFQLPEGGIQRLGGYLVDAPLVTLEPVGLADQARRLTLQQIARHPTERLEPGPYRVLVELPWGSWTTRLTVKDSVDPTVCALPASVGIEPLRNRYATRAGENDDGFGFIAATHNRPLSINNREWFCKVIAGLGLVVDWKGKEPRVEPFSSAPVPEWDQLFSVGRLNGISPERTAALLKTDLVTAVVPVVWTGSGENKLRLVAG